MKKKFMAVSCLAFACTFAFGACGGAQGSTGGNSTENSGGSSSGGNKGYISQEVLDLGAEFNSEYYPVEEAIEQKQGKIDVAILFEGTEKGWEAVANEYMRLQSNAVVVKLDTNWTAGNYPEKLDQELTSKTDWDIVQGNLASGGNTRTYCMNMQPSINTKNAYAGNKTWREVLMEDAYISDKTGTSTETFLMNSEGLQTAWFVNTVALEAAAEQGYVNAEGKAENPITWDDLMSLCSAMEKAGYSNPLGISVATDSINNSQFTWLLRVYGDYYYRNEYNNIMTEGSTYEVDLTAEQPEADEGYSLSNPKLFNSILGEDISANYVGGNSAKFKDFISQFGKMKDYLLLDAATTSMAQMRSLFQQQSNGKESPQIMLDYVGSGLSFAQSETNDFKIDFFDYPTMVSEYVEENTLLRDVGDNGGYLSIVQQGSEQNALTLDFMKFFMSPYGQTVYYKGLSDAKASPKGLTLVDNSLVIVPTEWKEYFETDKISFTGLSDSNPYITFLVRSLDSGVNSTMKAEELWKKYLTGTGSDAINAEDFGGQWQDSLMADWAAFCKNHSWNVNCYKYPEQDDTSFGG